MDDICPVCKNKVAIGDLIDSKSKAEYVVSGTCKQCQERKCDELGDIKCHTT